MPSPFPMVLTPRAEPVLPSCPSFFLKDIFVSLWYYTGGFVVTFLDIHVLYSKLVHPLHYSFFYPSSFLMVSSPGFNVPYSFFYRKQINHIHLFYPPSPTSSLSLAWPVWHFCPSLFRCLFIVQWDFCLGILWFCF
jgi:hypothetical protein